MLVPTIGNWLGLAVQRGAEVKTPGLTLSEYALTLIAAEEIQLPSWLMMLASAPISAEATIVFPGEGLMTIPAVA
jgi:hypothetical protein